MTVLWFVIILGVLVLGYVWALVYSGPSLKSRDEQTIPHAPKNEGPEGPQTRAPPLPLPLRSVGAVAKDTNMLGNVFEGFETGIIDRGGSSLQNNVFRRHQGQDCTWCGRQCGFDSTISNKGLRCAGLDWDCRKMP